MFIAAKESVTTKSIDGKLEQAQMKDWFRDGKPAGDAFKLLKLGDEVGNLLTNP